MEGYTFGLVVLTLLATLHSGRAVSRNEILTVGSVFKFQCDVNAKDPLKLFETPLLYSYYNPETQKSLNLSQNSQALVDGWSTKILGGSSSSFFPFELSKTVTLADSGVYTCSRGALNNSVVLTVEELKQDVGEIEFSISAVDNNGVPVGEEFVVTRQAANPDPVAKKVHIDSGYYQALCTAKGGTPKPSYTLRSGDIDLHFGHVHEVLLNSKSSDLSCHVQNGEFTHHLQFNLTINPGHPTFMCSKPTTEVGATDAEIDCVVSGTDLKCDQLVWISETDMSRLTEDTENYLVECQESVNKMNLKTILKFTEVKDSDFDDGFILKFENHLDETYQEINKLTKLIGGLSAGENLSPMGLMTILFLPVLGLLL